MTFDHLLAPLKLVTAIMKKEKAPVAVVPSASTLVFDSRDAAIYCLSISLIFATLTVLILAARR
jgi:hypothetical protein